MHREHLVERLGADDAGVGYRQLPPHQERLNPAHQHEEGRRHQVQQADLLVVGRHHAVVQHVEERAPRFGGGQLGNGHGTAPYFKVNRYDTIACTSSGGRCIDGM